MASKFNQIALTISAFSIFTAVGPAAHAQTTTGRLSGTITDHASGEGVYGALLIVAGTAKAVPAGIDGTYTLDLAPGTYTLNVNSVGFKPQRFENVVVKANETTPLNAVLHDNYTALGTVAVVGQKQTGSEVSLISDLRKSEVVVNGVSAEQIVKSQDRDAAEVAKRIPGVTIQDSRFILVRGLSERYNTVLLNDALAPSAEADVRAFSFDVLPAAAIDRILVFKNGAPELPGDFAGGAVKVYTRNSALQNATALTVQTSHRAGTTLGDFYTSTRSGTDFLGFDNGQRAMPDAFPQGRLTGLSRAQRADAGRALRNDWAPQLRAAAPDMRLSLGLTRLFEVGAARLSTVTAVSYSNTREQVTIDRFRYDNWLPSQQRSTREFAYQDRRGTQTVRLGVVHNWAARLSPRTKLEFRNLLNQIGTNQITVREGQLFANGTDVRAAGLRYDARRVYNGQLQGTHEVADAAGDDRTTLTWTGGYSYTNRHQPDYRRYRTQRPTGSTGAYEVVIPPGASNSDAARFFSALNEHTVMASGQWERRFGADTLAATAAADARPKLRAGFYAEQKKRDFAARWTSFTKASDAFDPALLTLPITEIFAPQNINPSTGFVLDEGTNPSDAYTAANALLAGYVGGATPLGARWNVSGGVRVEYNRQQLTSGDYSGRPVRVDNPLVAVLPSLNTTFSLTEKHLLRVAGSVTVNRPEFRELAPFAFYDFEQNYQIDGNPLLKTATIYNTDLRYEFYPSPSEMVSVGVFGKFFRTPIEKVARVTSGDPIFTFENTTSAYSGGVEVEARKSLADLAASSFWQRFALTLNASLITSRVRLTARQARVQEANRPMQGQSPYIVNAGVFYQDDEHGWSANALYNVVGRRIFVVGVRDQDPTIYELPRHVLDLIISKRLGTHFEVKAGVQDVLNQAVQFVQDSDTNGTIDHLDETIFRYRRGQYTTLGVTYRF